MKLKTFKYKNTTNTIWTSFDEGEVRAIDRDDAERKVIELLTNSVNLINSKLSKFATTKHLSIDMDMSQIEIEEVVPKFDSLCDIGFSVQSNSEEPTNNEIIAALERRLQMLKDNPDEIQEAIGICDTVEVTE